MFSGIKKRPHMLGKHAHRNFNERKKSNLVRKAEKIENEYDKKQRDTSETSHAMKKDEKEKQHDTGNMFTNAMTVEERDALEDRRAALPDTKYLTEKEAKLLNMDLKKIKNTSLRSELFARQQMLKDRIRRLRRRDVDKLGLGKIQPKTQEDMREKDEALVVEQNMDEVMEDQTVDEYASYFESDDTNTQPKILITTGRDGTFSQKNPSKAMLEFILDLVRIIPNALYVRRRTYKIKEIVEYAKNQNFTDIIVIGAFQNKPYSMIISHLPEGPTATFRVSSGQSRNMINKNPNKRIQLASVTDHHPELILNNFTTRIGFRVARMLSALFPKSPEFVGRRVVTFHNQRDFIFFRHHRYEFDTGESCNLHEIGPRFTLRLLKMQLGTFDTNFGEYEWYHTNEMDTSRRRFFL